MVASLGSAYNYVVTAHKPSAVTTSVVGNFTGPEDINLIISKSTRIEIHTLTPEGLQGIVDVPIYGRVAALLLLRPPGSSKDLLFFATERYQFAVLEWDRDTGELVTRANGDVQDRVGRPAENGIIGIVDPQCRMLGLHLYDGIFKVIPISERGQLQEAFNIRVEELQILDIKFLEGFARPTVAVLYQDPKRDRHIKTYEVNLKEKDFVDGPWQQYNLDAGASMIIPVPDPLGGALVVGESVITYIAAGKLLTTPIQQTTVRAYGRVDDDGSRYLLGDIIGHLYLLVLSHDSKGVLGLKLETLGRTSAPSSISYLDTGMVYLGSATGDSQLVQLHAQPLRPEEPGNFVEVLETFTNLGPIIDMCVVDLDRQGQGQVVTCSGARTDGSLRIVRNGIGMVGQATVELPGIRGLWNLRASYDDAHDTYLLLTFVGETRLLAINVEDELEEAEPGGIDANAQTLYCGNALGEQLVQVTPAGVRLLAAFSRKLITEWHPPPGLQINVAAGNPSQLLLACGEGNVVLLDIKEGVLSEAGHAKLSSDVATLDITPLEEGATASSLAAVGTWDTQMRLFRLPGLAELQTEALGGDVIARSVLFSRFEGVSYLLVALGDGHLLNYHIDPDTGVLSERKRISLGTKPISLRTFRSNGVSYVFAASDRPTVIYSTNHKLVYSNVNENEINFMTSFNSSAFPDSLAIAKEASLTIGSIDEVQKLHIRTIPLGEQPRRLCHQETSRAFLLITSPHIYATGLEDSTDSVRLMDDQTFDCIDTYQLDHAETGCSVASVRFADDPADYFVVGTAFVNSEEPEPSKGRILIFQAREGKLNLISEREVRGATYQVSAFQGKLLAGTNSRVHIFKWVARDDGSTELVPECSHTGHILALYLVSRGDFIVVGDLMRSVVLLVYKAEEGVLEMRAKDHNVNWMAAVDILDDETYIGAENSYNIFTLQRNIDAANDEDRSRLEVVGEFHLGEFVNRFRHGSLVMQMPDSDTPPLPTLLFGTINGVIGVLASLPEEQFGLLSKLQDAMRKVVKGVGGLEHTQWRSFQNERRTSDSRNFIDGDLVEQFLDLKRDAMDRVVGHMRADISVEDLGRTVEELSRALH